MKFVQRTLYTAHQTSCPTPVTAKATRQPQKWSTAMKIFARLFSSRREANLSTLIERNRLSNTMPGQTGAVQANRLGFLIG